MLDFIERKIEAIRQEPEHVRIRYVWGMVAMVMVIVFFVWITNLRESFRTSGTGDDIETIRETLPEQPASVFEETEPSLEAEIGEGGE